MTTEASEHLIQGKAFIQDSINELSAIVVDHAPGYEKFPPVYYSRLKAGLITLLDIRDDLGENL